MGNYNIETLKKEASKYTLTEKSLSDILDSLKKSITTNSNVLTDANKEDVKINKKQIKIKKILDIIEKYRTAECSQSEGKKKMVIYKGDPYITLHLCLQALTQNTKVVLLHEEFMVGVNRVLISIIKNTFEKYDVNNLVDDVEEYDIIDINKINKFFDNVVVIGDTIIYQLLKNDGRNVKFFSYNNIALYCESDDLIKLQEAIYIYANENQYEIEILYCDSIKDAIKTINNDKYKNMAILLTRSNENKEEFMKSVTDKDVYVNDNPFKEELGRIYNYLG